MTGLDAVTTTLWRRTSRFANDNGLVTGDLNRFVLTDPCENIFDAVVIGHSVSPYVNRISPRDTPPPTAANRCRQVFIFNPTRVPSVFSDSEEYAANWSLSDTT